MAKSKLVQANEKIAESVVDGYKKIENGVVSGYKKIETGVVEGFTKMTDHFVDQFLTKEGETVAEAKARLAREQSPAGRTPQRAGGSFRPAAQGEVTLPKRTRKAPAKAGAFFRGSLGANNSLTILCYSINTMGLFWPQGANMTRLCCHARRRYTQCFKS